MWYRGPKAIRDAIDHAKFSSRSRDAVIRVYDEAGQRDRNARTRGRLQRVGKLQLRPRNALLFVNCPKKRSRAGLWLFLPSLVTL
jgi:hypothetical protein